MLKDIILGATVWEDVSIEVTTVTGGHSKNPIFNFVGRTPIAGRKCWNSLVAKCAPVMLIATSESSRILLQGGRIMFLGFESGPQYDWHCPGTWPKSVRECRVGLLDLGIEGILRRRLRTSDADCNI